MSDLVGKEDHLTSAQHLTFVLAGEEFAVPILQVREILEFSELTHIPMVPEFIPGVTNLRGSAIPVVDLVAKFGLPIRKLTRRACIIIAEVKLEGEVIIMGMLVDKVLQVQPISKKDIEPPPNFGSKIKTEFIKGMGQLNGRFVIILDVEKVLSADEVALLCHVRNDAQLDIKNHSPSV